MTSSHDQLKRPEDVDFVLEFCGDPEESVARQYIEALEARAALAQPEPEDLPPGYIDAEHTGHDRKMLETFYKACRSEGGTADEIHLRGLKALLALAQPEPADLSIVSWPDPGPITARAVLADGKCYLRDTQPEPEPGEPTVMEIIALADEIESEGGGQVDLVRVALARWGRPTSTQPTTTP